MAALRWNKKRNVISETLRRSEKVRPLGLPCNSSPRYFAAFLLNSDTVFLFPFVRVHILCFPSSYLILSSTKNPIVLRSSPSPIFFLHQENFLLYFPPPPNLFDFVRVSAHLFPCIIPATYYTNTRRKRRGFDASFLVYTVSNCPKNPAWNTSTSSHVPFDRFQAPCNCIQPLSRLLYSSPS